MEPRQPTPQSIEALSACCAGQPCTVLVVDDSRPSVDALAALLDGFCEVLKAGDGIEALDIARARMPDLVLLDVLMPRMGGFEVLRQLRADPRTEAIPVVFTSGLDAPEDEARGLHLGGADYLTKPLEPEVVLARVALHLRAAQRRRDLESMALVDSLTGIANRRRFDQALAEECNRATRTGEPLAVVLADIDDFKLFNDFYGHLAGDAALRSVAQALAAGLKRPGDLVARYGGEEFGMLLPATSAAQAEELLELLQEAVRALAIPHARSARGTVLGFSAGIAAATAGVSARPLDLLLQADDRLYVAKARQRSRVDGMAPAQRGRTVSAGARGGN